MIKFKLIINLVLFSVPLLFLSCKKEAKTIYKNPAVDSSYISITNASPAISNLQLYLNNQTISLPDSPLSFGNTSYTTYINNANQFYPDTSIRPYIKLPSGYLQLGFGSYGNSNIIGVLNSKFEPGGSYSVFITDTINHGNVTSIVLSDFIGTTDSTKGQMRFINLSPDAPPLDLWAYPNGGANGFKVFSDCAYLPNDFNSIVNAQSFTIIDAGFYYFVATSAGTSNVVLQGGLFIPGKGVITVYAKGFVAGTGITAINVGVIGFEQQ